MYISISGVVAAKAKNWIQKTVKSPKFEEGTLRKHFGLKKDQKITMKMINSELGRLEKKKVKSKDGKYDKNDLELVRKLNFAKNVL
jgi:hypothetical protein